MISIIRHLEYKKISDLKIDGDVLDLGGSTKSGYHQLLKGEHKITTVNINKEYGCDIVFDIQKKFPLEDDGFDSVWKVPQKFDTFSMHSYNGNI